MSNRVFGRSATELFSRFFSDIIEKVSSRFKTGRARLDADKDSKKKTVDNWADGLLEFGGMIPDSIAQAIFFEMAGVKRNDYLRKKPWNLAFNFLCRGFPEITIVPEGEISSAIIVEILKKLRDEGDPRFEMYAAGLSQYIKDLGAPLVDGLPVYRAITMQEYYQAIFHGSGIFMPVMTPTQTRQFAQMIDITIKYQSNIGPSHRANSLQEIFAQLCKISTSSQTLTGLKDNLAEVGIDLATLQGILAAWGFQFETDFTDNNLATLTQNERDCRDYWFTLMESSSSIHAPPPPAAIQSLISLFHSTETIDTLHVNDDGETVLINQWYLMRFECYLKEIDGIEKRIVKHRGTSLSAAERLQLYQTLLGAVKDADGNPIFPIPQDPSSGFDNLLYDIECAYDDLNMKLPGREVDAKYGYALWRLLYDGNFAIPSD
ncbi:MAG: hypothetical protein ACTSYI_09325 [Promethearchaeota archaeon]